MKQLSYYLFVYSQQKSSLTFSVHIYNNNNMIRSGSFQNAIRFMHSIIKEEIQFTKAFNDALDRKLSERKENQFLRLEINAGEGCEGYTYKFKFDNQLKDNDYVTLNQAKRISFALGKQQLQLVSGSTIDYVKQMMRQTFYVKENPNAQISCSCKTSFSPKEFLL